MKNEKFRVLRDVSYFGVDLFKGEVWQNLPREKEIRQVVADDDFVSLVDFDDVKRLVDSGVITVTDSTHEHFMGVFNSDYSDEFKRGDSVVWGRIEEGRLRPNLRRRKDKPKSIFGLSVYSLPSDSYEVLDES